MLEFILYLQGKKDKIAILIALKNGLKKMRILSKSFTFSYTCFKTKKVEDIKKRIVSYNSFF